MKKSAALLILASFLFLFAGAAEAARPTVQSTIPANGETNVMLNIVIRITFDQPMDPVRINTDNITVRRVGGSGVTGTVTYDSATNTAIFTPSGNLAQNREFEVTVSSQVRNTNNERMNSSYSFRFRTGSSVGDLTRPRVSSTSPAHNAVGIPVNQAVAAVFNESMDAASVTAAGNFVLLSGVTSVPGTVTYIGGVGTGTATFTPSANLAPSTLYTAKISTNMKDLAGNLLNPSNSPIVTIPESYTWQFTTVNLDTTPPVVTATSPVRNATDVSVNTVISANFSEAMKPSAISTSTVILKLGASTVAGTVTYDAAQFKVTFTPSAPLQNGMTYDMIITTGVQDEVGNAMAANYTWSFTTVSGVVVADMKTYCQTPPFITTNSRVKPNVLLIVDNSGSMEEFAYKAPGKGRSTFDDSYNSTSEYYGYFSPNHMYKYTSTSGGFFEIDTTVGIDKNKFDPVTNSFSGNMLNWMSMRRVDVVRKVLVGGKTSPRSANTANYLIAYEGGGNDSLKAYGTKWFKITSGASYATINVCSTNQCNSPYTNTYNVKVYVGNNPPDEGIIVKMQDQIRFGIEFFNDGYRFENNSNSVRDGGYIAVDIGSTGTNLITQVENTDPSTYTPLAEALYEATRYFQATSSAYNNGTYNGKDPIEYACQRNFVLLITDGESTKDQNLPGGAFAGTEISDITNGNFNVQTYMDKIAAIEGYPSQKATDANTMDGTYYLEAVAYYSHVTDFRRGAANPLGALGKSDIAGTQNLTLYTVFAFDDSPVGRELLQKAAKYGAYTEKDSVPGPNLRSEWDKDGDGIPDTYFEAQQGGLVGEAIQRALNDILAQVASGTATSVLSSSEGSGATLIQALFFPKKIFGTGAELSWLGEMQNTWYYLDPKVNYSKMREDTDVNYMLDLSRDYIVESFFDNTDGLTKVNRFSDANGDGSADSATPDEVTTLDAVKALWRTGKKLFLRNLGLSPRTVYTTLDSASLTSLSSVNVTDASVQSLLQAANSTEATKLINYTMGVDQAGYRTRTTSIDGVSGTWRLGDIINSTPKVQSQFALNPYAQTYADETYTAFLKSSSYKGRDLVYVGANDGMLHAFRFGTLDQRAEGTVKAKLCQDDNKNNNCDAAETATSELGSEKWAFIPKNALPYLKYMADPNYCHIYSVDLTPIVFDASIGTDSCSEANYWDCDKFNTAVSPSTTFTGAQRWRTILIGGMRLGGGCKDVATANGVPIPVAGAGYSSYFALDVTVPDSPQLLWEFVPPAHDLGFSTTGAVIVRINARDMSVSPSEAKKNKNGRWFAIFASGPTGPIDTTYGQFKGFSDQNLKLFVLDLKTGQLAIPTIDTGIANAFGGTLHFANADYDLDYQDDAFYVGYTKKCTAASAFCTVNEWNDGGVLRVTTREDLNDNSVAGTALNPANWEVSDLINGIGPVTTSLAHLSHYPVGSTVPDKSWLYFGTGRYFYTIPSGSDDTTVRRQLFAVNEPCLADMKMNKSCSDTVSFSSLGNAATASGAVDVSGDPDPDGWYISLNTSLGTLFSERVTTDPVATSTGIVYFTTFAPGTDVCSFGGNSYLWAVKYDTGGSVSDVIRGKALIQLSSGAIEEVDLRTALTDEDGRRTGKLDGMAGGSPTFNVPPKPKKKIIHLKRN